MLKAGGPVLSHELNGDVELVIGDLKKTMQGTVDTVEVPARRNDAVGGSTCVLRYISSRGEARDEQRTLVHHAGECLLRPSQLVHGVHHKRL